MRAQQFRTTHGYRVFSHQAVGRSAGPVSITEIDGSIEVGICEQKRACAVGQVDRDIRVLLLEVLEPGQQPLRAEGGHHGQLDHVGALLAHDGQRVPFYSIQLDCNAPTVGDAGFCQFYATLGASEQFYTQKLFQAGDLSANSPLSDGKLLCGLGKAFMARSRFEADPRLSFYIEGA